MLFGLLLDFFGDSNIALQPLETFETLVEGSGPG